jgi:hypothetical protein
VASKLNEVGMSNVVRRNFTYSASQLGILPRGKSAGPLDILPERPRIDELRESSPESSSFAEALNSFSALDGSDEAKISGDTAQSGVKLS